MEGGSGLPLIRGLPAGRPRVLQAYFFLPGLAAHMEPGMVMLAW
jgi:hypothetical protein